jgi:hypothetical protein
VAYLIRHWIKIQRFPLQILHDVTGICIGHSKTFL